MASNCVNLLDKKFFVSNIAIKVDIRKVFDSMSCSLILDVLHRFGFSDGFCVWIEAIFYFARIFILTNRYPKHYFKCLRSVSTVYSVPFAI